MPALNFQKRFAEAVRECWKRQTIRARRKHPIKPGDMLHLYTGMRTKNCVKIAVVKCKSVKSIIIDWANMIVGNRYLHIQARTRLANADGFNTYFDMAVWFRKNYGLPFTGVLIKWEKWN